MFMLASVVSKYMPNPNLLPFIESWDLRAGSLAVSKSALNPCFLPSTYKYFQFLWKASVNRRFVYDLPPSPQMSDRASFGNAVFLALTSNLIFTKFLSFLRLGKGAPD